MPHVHLDFDSTLNIPYMQSDAVSVAFPDADDSGGTPDTCVLMLLHPDRYWLSLDMDADATRDLITCLQQHLDQMGNRK